MCVAMETSSTRKEGPRDVGLSGSDLTLAMIEASKALQTVFFTKVGYHIGQLGLISCFDLHHMVLRRGLSPPTFIKGVELTLRVDMSKTDPWAVYSPSCPDPRLLFVLHNGRLASPAPVALSVEDLEEHLRLAECALLLASVSVDSKKGEVALPQWLYDCRADLTKPVGGDPWSSSLEDPSGLHSDLAFLKYIHSRVEKEKADVLLPLIEASEMSKVRKVSISVQPDKGGVGYSFHQKHKSSTPKTSPKTRKKKFSRELSRKVLSPSPTHPAGTGAAPVIKVNYSFTPETLTFIKQRAPLLAALVHLISPPSTVRERKTNSYDKDDPKSGIEISIASSGKKSLMQTLRSKVTGTTPLPPPPAADVAGEAISSWRKMYREILSHFTSAQPMYKYLVSRLSCFDSLIQWDGTQGQSGETRSPSNSKERTENAVGLRTLAVLPSTSSQVGEACNYALRKLLDKGLIADALKLISSEPAAQNSGSISLLSDELITCAFITNHEEVRSFEQSSDDGLAKVVLVSPVSLLSRLSDPERASRLALASLQTWPVKVSVDMLSYCSHHLPFTSPLAPPVREKLDCLKVYSVIMATCDSPLHSYKWESTKSPWKKWLDLASDSATRPDYVLRILLTSKTFVMVRQWAAVHKLGAEFTQQIEVEYLGHLLEGNEGDPIAAQQVGIGF